jgi:beta-glucanase (GH16 family)
MKKMLYNTLLMLALFACSKKNSGGDADAIVPVLKVTDVTQSRENANSTYRFYVYLQPAVNKTVTVDYTTIAGTAKANKDFLPAQGKITFQPNQAQAYAEVTIVGDSLRQEAQQFTVQLSNAVNGTIGAATATGTIINNGTYLPVSEDGYTTPTTYTGYNLAWSDEFEGKSLSAANWGFETGTGGNGWGNNELEYYTARPENLFLSQGKMVIEARKESYSGKEYTSARVITKAKKEFKFGRIDIRAKLPKGKGVWPALWMLGSNISQVNWPNCGEIDIMEQLGHMPATAYGTLHWGPPGATSSTSTSKEYTLPTGDFYEKFHVFTMLWEENSIKLLIDDQQFFSAGSSNVTNTAYPFNSPFFFICNVAVGGNWPGSPDNTTVLPQRLFVDYIRVFQK